MALLLRPTLVRPRGSLHWAPRAHFRSRPGRFSLRAFTWLRRKLLTHLPESKLRSSCHAEKPFCVEYRFLKKPESNLVSVYYP